MYRMMKTGTERREDRKKHETLRVWRGQSTSRLSAAFANFCSILVVFKVIHEGVLTCQFGRTSPFSPGIPRPRHRVLWQGIL